MTHPTPGAGTRKKAILPMGTLACTLALACARVEIRKVPTPTQYGAWSDELQKEADSMEGVRFYLPRPFVNVFESFPVSTDVYLVPGTVSPDGKYVVIHAQDVDAESGLFEYMASTETITVDARVVHRPSAEDLREGLDALRGFSPQSGKEDDAATATEKDLEGAIERAKEAATRAEDAANKAEESAKAAKDAAKLAERAGGGSVPEEPTGINEKKVTNDNTAFAYQPLRGNFDVVYLPDFEEQYVVTSKAGLGSASFAVNMGQSWSLQGFNSLADNSELNARIFDLIDTSISIAKTAAGDLIGPAQELGSGAVDMFQPQGGREDPDVGEPGTRVMLKIVVVHYAAKGLYPVLKPRELYREPAFSVYIDPTGAEKPKVARGWELPPQLSKQTLDEFVKLGRQTVPVYPYQYISFNTFKYLAIQLVTEDSAPFGTLYDQTGTVGDPGDRQAGDFRDSILPRMSEGRNDVVPLEENIEQVIGELSQALERNLDERQRAKLRTNEQGQVVVRIEHPAGAPDSWKNVDRENLRQLIESSFTDLGREKYLGPHEIPPTEEDLQKLADSLRASVAKNKLAKHWIIENIAVEASGVNVCKFNRRGDIPENGMQQQEFEHWLEERFVEQAEFWESGERKLQPEMSS